MSQASIQGMIYFVIFEDAATSYKHVYFMRNKNDVLDNFKIYNAIVKIRYLHSVRILHTNNGGEYVNKDFKVFFIGKDKPINVWHHTHPSRMVVQNGKFEQ